MIIQGGMGIGVSGWLLAKTISEMGYLGVVSGTALDTTLVRHLQIGDLEGHYRRAISKFPVPEVAQRILDRYFIPGGKPVKEAFKLVPMFIQNPSQSLQELTVVANFAEVFLAKEGHKGLVGINLLEKLILPNLFSLYGAMLADVDYVIMGAGIPREIPKALDDLANHEETSLKLSVKDASPDDDYKIAFNPKKLFKKALPKLKRPKFLGIISSVTLARVLTKKTSAKVDGFIVEGSLAGGHNAPPRGLTVISKKGEPVYGDRDKVDLEIIKKIGLPFWLAGSYGSPEGLKKALASGAQGIQAGTAFAFSEESGFTKKIKEKIKLKALENKTDVFTDPKVSPTGFPFKVVSIEKSLSEEKEFKARPRHCDIGYLRHMYKKADGSLGYRCSAEPVESYVQKGGSPYNTKGRKCLCNALVANVGLPQLQKNGYLENILVTAGNDIKSISRFFTNGNFSYSSKDVIQYLLELIA